MITSRIESITADLIYAPFSGAWELIGGFFDRPAYLVRIDNSSNVTIRISLDGGRTIWGYCGANSVFELMAPINPQYNCNPANFPAGTQVAILGTAGAGFVTMSAFTYYSGQ